MPDADFLAAIQDQDAFRRYIDNRLTEAMRTAIQKINDEEDDRLLWGIPVVVDDTMPADQIQIVVSDGVERQTVTVKFKDGQFVGYVEDDDA